jgi:hypothetical protein
MACVGAASLPFSSSVQFSIAWFWLSIDPETVLPNRVTVYQERHYSYFHDLDYSCDLELPEINEHIE